MGMERRKGTDKEQARNSKERGKEEGRNGQGMGKTMCKGASSGKLNKLSVSVSWITFVPRFLSSKEKLYRR